MTRTALFLLATALPAAAQTSLTPDALLDLLEGRSATFSRPDGALVGTEQFLSRTRSVWARADGTCSYGDVTVEGAELCFVYEDSPARKHCWWPFDDGGPAVRYTTTPETVQRITEIHDRPVFCDGAFVS